jgi:homoserine acetyltransferase
MDAYSVGWLNIWAAPIMLDPKWNHGDYYGKDEPVEGLALALKTVTPPRAGTANLRSRTRSTRSRWPAPRPPTPTRSSISPRRINYS